MTHLHHSARTLVVPGTVAFSKMQEEDEPRVQALHAHVFGPGRLARTAFRLREKADALLTLSLVAEDQGALIGAVSLSRIAVGETRGILLGPLAVLPEKRDIGIGKALLAKSVTRAFAAREPFVLLIGDLPYYATAGFQVVPIGTMTLPGPVNPQRLLIAVNPSCGSMPTGDVRGLGD